MSCRIKKDTESMEPWAWEGLDIIVGGLLEGCKGGAYGFYGLIARVD